MYRQLLKHIFAYSLLTLTYSTCFGQFKHDDPWLAGITGKIDSVVVNEYDIKRTGTEEAKEFNGKTIYIFNSKGLLIEERLPDRDTIGSGAFRTIYSYDERGDRSMMLFYTPGGTLRRKTLYNFDAEKREVVVKTIANIITAKMLLDKAGNILESISYNKYPTLSATTRFKYNDEDLCTESVTASSRSSHIEKTMYTYNDNGDLVSEITYENLELRSRRTYSYAKYNERHNWLVQNVYLDNQLTWVNERTITYQK